MNERSESGFSLPELLVAVSILTIIIGVLAQAFSTAVHTVDTADRRIASSTDDQLLATWFGGDAQSSLEVVSGGSRCLAAGDASVGTFSWVDLGVTIEVTYATRPAGTDVQLVRNECRDGSDPGVGHLMARHLSSDAPTLTCTPACDDATSVTLALTDADGHAQSFLGSRRVTS